MKTEEDYDRIAAYILESIGYDNSLEDIQRNKAQGYLSYIEGRDGEDYVWYMDESSNICIRASDGYELTEKEMEEQFA